MRCCTNCNNLYPPTTEYFYRRRNGRGLTLLESECKPCRKAKFRAYKTKEAIKINTIQKNERYQETKAWIHELKRSTGCFDCGYNNPLALDFDHVRGKKLFTICARMRGSRKRLEEEIAKCEIVCANCHRIRTAARPATRRNYGRPRYKG